jgi:mannose-6-phosphate isomerase-like protein (cupin superfamily)
MDLEVTRAPTVVRQGSGGGAPLGTSGRARLKILNEPGHDGGYALIEGRHPVGEPRIRDHLHTRHEETFLVLEGQYEVRLGHAIVLVAAGDYVFVPRGTPHTYRNPGPAPSRVLNVISPPDGVQLLAELGTLAGTNVDEQLLAEIHSRHAASIVNSLPGW